MENLTNSVLEQLLGSGPLGPVLVLSMIALIWMTKNLLSSKDAQIKLLKEESKKKDVTIEMLMVENKEEREKTVKLITDVTVNTGKMADLIHNHDSWAKEERSKAQRYREKIFEKIDWFEKEFLSLPCKSKWLT